MDGFFVPGGNGQNSLFFRMSQDEAKSDVLSDSGQEPSHDDVFLSSIEENSFDPILGMDHAPLSDNTPTIISPKKPSTNGNGRGGSSVVRGDLRGRCLAHFELIEPIGVGGMAAVLRARDKQLDRLVALKILPPDMAQEPENIKRFHQEARAAAKLDHENIARVFFCGEDQGLHFIAFEFVEGENLRTILEQRTRLPVGEAVHYMLQIATGLTHAAARGVVHRDIKPSNIIITPTGRAKLVDMGLARSQEPHGTQALTQSGVTLGTFDYISPEQALEPRNADVRSDIYSLGCTFYHALTGKPPVPDGTAAKKLHHHHNVAPLDPRELNSEIPDNVAVILARMMSKDVKGRYQTPELLVQHLMQAAQELVLPVQTTQGAYYVDSPLPVPPKQNTGFLTLVAMLCLGLFVVLLSLFQSRPADQGDGDFLAMPQAKNKTTKPPIFEPDPKILENPSIEKKNQNPFPQTDLVPVISDQSQLRDAISKRVKRLPIKGVVDVNGIEMLVTGGTAENPLIFEPARSETSAELRIHVDIANDFSMAGLRITEGHVIFRNLTINLVTGSVGAESAKSQLASLAITNDAMVQFSDCIIRQSLSFERLTGESVAKLNSLASIRVDGSNSDGLKKPKVNFDKCFFPGGQTALAINGTADIAASNCGFGPHLTLFYVHGKNKKSQPAEIALTECSAFLTRGPFVRVADDAFVSITNNQCIFSNPGRHDPLVNLIDQVDSLQTLVKYDGRKNVFHHLNGFLVRNPALSPSKALVADWAEFASEMGLSLEDARSSLRLDQATFPWRNPTPLKSLDDNPKLAFQIDPTNLSLWEKQGSSWIPVGVETCVWGKTYDKVIEPVTPTTPEMIANNKELIVDPESSEPGIRRTLLSAVADAEDGAVILIRHDGPLAVEPRVILDDRKNIVIKPYAGRKPELVLSRKLQEIDSSLFQIKQGSIHFQQMAFALEPDRKEAKSRSIVQLTPQGECTFTDCLITLYPARDFRLNSVEMNVVSMADTAKRMSPTGLDVETSLPKISFYSTVIRGQGQVTQLVGAMPFEIRADDCLISLNGSLVNMQVNLPEPILSKNARIVLNRTTTYLASPMVQLADRKAGKALLFTDVFAQDCLFAAANGKPLVSLEGVNNMEQMRRLLTWKGRHNAYCGYQNVLEQQPVDGGALPITGINWLSFAGESENLDPDMATRIIKSTVEMAMIDEYSLANTTPEAFRKAISELQATLDEQEKFGKLPTLSGFGVDLTRLQTRLYFPSRPTQQTPLPIEEMMIPDE